ncbi:MAG TPA: hypothetical protein VE175_07445 [Woeseiaceae bacterium]|nr:hypothetical protein [Woeseiaceae bacterium]
MTGRRDYERSDVSVPAAVLAIVAGSLMLAVIALVLWQMTRELSEDLQPPAAAPVPALEAQPGRPRLQGNPQVDRQELEAGVHRRLESSGWVDRERGVAHIPIERAMAMLAERGWPEGAP